MEQNTHDIVRGGELLQCTPTEFGKIVKITITAPSQPNLDFCPSQKKHFFCGIAKSLGCQFCAPKEPGA